FGLKNDGNGNVKLNNTDKFDMSNEAQQYGPEVGMPMQPAQGASCPGTNNPAQCTTESSAMPFNDNMGTLVRDNDVVNGMCSYHLHLVNQITVTHDRTRTTPAPRAT